MTPGGERPGMTITAVVRVTLEPSWYQLPRQKRLRLRASLARVLASQENLKIRWFDSGPWMGRIAEFFVCEFSNLLEYWRLWNDLREHPMFLESYASLERVTLGRPSPAFLEYIDADE